MNNAEALLNDALVSAVQTMKNECRYNPSLFINMLNDDGPVITCKKLITAKRESEGFRKLWDLKRLDLSVEAIIQRPEFDSLFSDDDRLVARKRLDSYKYTIPIDSNLKAIKASKGSSIIEAPSSISDYNGISLPIQIKSFIKTLQRYNFKLTVTGPAKKTIRISKDETSYGYINESVINKNGYVGFCFEDGNNRKDSSPESLAQPEDVVKWFCGKFDCEEKDITVIKGSGSNTGYTYLIIMAPDTALRALLIETNQSIDEDLILHTNGINSEYIEGRLKDVTMTLRERDPKARKKCLEHYGYSCFVCKENIREKYNGLPIEIIHVHHEIPLNTVAEDSHIDPVESMKPLCPNCHAVIHSKIPPYTIKEISEMILAKSTK